MKFKLNENQEGIFYNILAGIILILIGCLL